MAERTGIRGMLSPRWALGLGAMRLEQLEPLPAETFTHNSDIGMVAAEPKHRRWVAN
ncbi:hypothetical protein VQ045_17815 [Aurantimonas sp. E1-2-R+4]|uniref:hypothetical protein n=1 Tax=Aurantimonas sp. E1-2-R+4 TaxID=3113714 RepID=UPI002F950474